MAEIHQHPPTHLRRTSPYSLASRAIPTRHIDVSDSESDDSPPPAIKFSKVTEALLNDRRLPSSPIRQHSGQPVHRPLRSVTGPATSLSTPDRGIKILRKSSPSALPSNEVPRGNTPPRIVHLSSGQNGSARRTISISGPYPQRAPTQRIPFAGAKEEVVTPIPASRSYTISRPRAGSNTPQEGHQAVSSRPSSRNGPKVEPEPCAAKVATSHLTSEPVLHSSTSRTRYLPADLSHLAGSQRIKRAPIATGTMLRSGPVRRGFRRRDSDEDVSPTDEYHAGQPSSGSNHNHSTAASRVDSVMSRAVSAEPISTQDFAREPVTSRPSSRQATAASVKPAPHLLSPIADMGFGAASPFTQREQAMPAYTHTHESRATTQAVHVEQKLLQRAASVNNQPHRYGIHNTATSDQENAPPPTFRRNEKARGVLSVMSDDEQSIKPVQAQEVTASIRKPARKPLDVMSNNTPYRPAPPPPPKMSILETATATVGASSSKSRKKRSHIVINGKLFTQMGRIGKGGSSEVFLVMAENYKTFAMKKVRLDNCDESAVRGFKGEIDLLKKLTDVDRVIRLYDWELNEEKQELLVLMERGDTDLYRIMTLKNGGHDGRFDSTFTRYYWKEMLECVQAVHDHDIVHSDLKPANFLVVQGRLKLIDFGIANAIEVDHTCNVHRESHVGTPNYMSPESIIDTSSTSSSGQDAQGRPLRKDMKIGKSSDVWSLGCMLYQMTYGRPPFAHIPTIPRIMAITNPKHIIEFPDTGIGGVTIPASLKGVLRRCLQREADRRPTIPQLLSESNEFLYPEAAGAVMVRQEVLEQIISKVVERCRDTKRGLPQASEIAQYAPSFMNKIREMSEKI